MVKLNRRNWLQQSLLASSALLIQNPSPLTAKFLEDSSHSRSEPIPLHWNENPYGPSQKALHAMTEAAKSANRYPDERVSLLKKELALSMAVDPSQIIITAGSTELLCLAGQHVGLTKGEILTPWPSFPTMILFGKECGAKIKKVPLGKEDVIDLDTLKESISAQTSLIFICNPNNPTSTEVDTDDLKSFCRDISKDILVFVDEAYIEFSERSLNGSLVSLVEELPNLIISRTFSKAHGLAGMRIGYGVSQQQNIVELSRRHPGRELATGTVSLAAATASLADKDFIDMCIGKNEEGRHIVYRAFDSWGVRYNKSSTNFIYARSAHFDRNVRSRLQEHNIMITKWPDMKNHIRISIGKPDEMNKFIEVVEQFLV